MKTKELTAKNFDWINIKKGDAKVILNNALDEIKRDIQKIKAIKEEDRTFENTIEAFEYLGETGSEKMRYIEFLMNVHTDRAVVDEISKVVSEYTERTIELIYDEGLFRAFVEYKNKREKLDGERKILFEDTVKSFKRMGFELSRKDREKLKKNRQKISKFSLSYEQNLNRYQDFITLNKVDAIGLPQNILDRFNKDKNGNYIVTLDYPEIGPFLEFSPNDKKRKEISNKNLKKGGKRNLQLIKEIVKLRNENAKILGYKTHAHFVIEERMAKTPEDVYKFINPLIKKLNKIYKEENKKVLDVKTELKGVKQKGVTYYDGYYRAELSRRSLGFSSEDVRPYLSLQNVLDTLFGVYSKILGVEFRENKNIPT